jgi:phosphopantothenoylcysteine decarboxylase/phosphopantothenate--cysteine ligase
MNTKMWENPVTQQNVEKLKERGFIFSGPATGELACGYEGKGRLAELDDILEETTALITEKDLHGEHILITAGPTQEQVDPIRFLTNRSSGKMGYALAHASQKRGAEVMLITGPTTINPPPHIRTIPVTSALDMDKAVSRHYKSCTIVIKTAAVADYRPKKYSHEKMKKEQKSLTLELERNPDILYKLGKNKGKRFLVGFAAETKNLISQAKGKLDRKNLDLIVVNHALQKEGGFGSDNNEVTLIDYEGRVETLPRMEKTGLADKILDRVKELKAEKKVAPAPKKTAEKRTKGKRR